MLFRCEYFCKKLHLKDVSFSLSSINAALLSSEARWPRSMSRWSKRIRLLKRRTDTEGSLGWRRTGWTRWGSLIYLLYSVYLLPSDAGLLSRRPWATTMWHKWSSTPPRRTWRRDSAGNSVFRKTELIRSGNNIYYLYKCYQDTNKMLPVEEA